MDAGSSQVETRPLIEADFGDNGGRVAFASINEAREWIEHEIAVWRNFWSQIEICRLVPNVGEHQLKLPKKIREALNGAEQAERSDQPKALKEIKKLFKPYADYGSLCSKSTLGKRLLDAPRHQHAFAKIGALASPLGIPAEDILDSGQANEQQAAMILSGYALGTMRNFVKRSEIADHLSRMDE